jgi:hypothetical protein
VTEATKADLPNGGLSVPALVRQRVEHLGAVGSEWLQTLPRLVAELEESWSIRVGHAVSGGSAAFVAPVVTSRGELVTLKIALPVSGFDEQVTVLEDAHGRGYARLIAQDVTRQAGHLSPEERGHLPVQGGCHVGPGMERSVRDGILALSTRSE